MCRGERGEPALHTQYSNPQPLWITGESSPVSLIINPSRTQHLTNDSLSLSCEDQSNSTGWTVRRYTHSPSGVEAPFSVLMLICSVVTASPYLLVTFILLLICYRARAHTDEDRIENAVIEE
ncbi:hypothetical protein QTP70_015263 [Hemibagrus guttatus]|uniref:Ig-like domain-containing protein n=1 Tax=Hemibagrus guttatus TaxID=175788 RepID=A0AAE0V8Y3_9TELE|nr:hypothetical protein QTP70_015263 [Hemibagrus guttatus]